MKTAAEQRLFFATFGYLFLRRAFSPIEMAALSAEFDSLMATSHVSRLSRTRRHTCLFMDSDSIRLRGLALDERILNMAQALLGRRVICIQVVGTRHVGDTQWHSDNLELRYRGVKFLLYLDRLDANSGALRVMPGSHRHAGRSDRLRYYDSLRSFGLSGEELPGHVLDSRPGDVIAFAHPLWHASFNGQRGRRMVEVNFYADPRGETELKAFCEQMRMNHGVATAAGVQMYPTSWRESAHPAVCGWTKRLADLHLLDPPSPRASAGRKVDMQASPPKPAL